VRWGTASDMGAAAGRRFMARARARPCRPDAAGCGMPGGGSVADERARRGERERVTGGTPRQILFWIKNTPERK
jgi:hypothetical protein